METQKFEFFFLSSKFEFWLVTKSWNLLNFVNIRSTLVILIHQWKDLHEYYNIETKKIRFFSKKFEIEFLLLLKSWNHLSFLNISPTLVIYASMERSSRVLQHVNPKIWFFFFSKKFVWLVLTSWNHLSFVNTILVIWHQKWWRISRHHF